MRNLSPGVVARLMPVVILSMFCLLSQSLRVPSHHHAAASIDGEATKVGDKTQTNPKEGVKEEVGTELYPTGSSLPDCSHACGPCFPCKRVMVSFKCSIAESCPVVYRCMCKGKYYHVPSN